MNLKEKAGYFMKSGQNAYLKNMIGWRRYFHMNPELSNHEKNTSEVIAELLAGFGLEVKKGIGGYGVVGKIKTGRQGPGIALRADMDALALNDPKKVPYRSRVEGVTHACGHDGHMAILLGVAEALSEIHCELKGELTFVFQPSEELLPGGAVRMIDEGCLEGVDSIYGFHLVNSMTVGQAATTSGPMMASSDFFDLTIHGKGGHGAVPEESIDPVIIAAQVLNQFQTIISRQISPLEPAVLSIGSIHGGTANNIIPDKVDLKGTFRCFNETTAVRIKKQMNDILEGICKGYGSKFTLKFPEGFPLLSNSQKQTALLLEAARGVIAETDILVQDRVMISEDFGNYLRHVPGCYMFIGSRNPGSQEFYGNHHPKFDIDENALEIGAQVLIRLVMENCSVGR